MAKINKLSPHVADLIAAGEVVERPGSVIKELVENSIDAGATVITVEIRNGGMSYMRVSDNGCGMAADDAEIAFLRHATSKLHDERGLEAIGTLGFRGEALAAISAVSRINMLTREASSDSGTDISLEGSTVMYKRPAGCPVGTTITVRDLFFNTPARLKFMKSDRAEGANVSAVVQRIALSHPEISIRYIKDGKEEYHTPGDGRIDSCVYSILGRDFASGLLEVTGVDSDIPVTGYVTVPVNARGNRSFQFFYVNGRFVKSKTLQAALEQAYRNSLFTGRFPCCILYISINFAAVDVNVHPTKTEVKFLNEKAVFGAVYYSVLAALEGESKKAEIALSAKTRELISEDAARGGVTGSGAESGRTSAHGSPASHTAKQNPDFFKTLSSNEYKALFGNAKESGGWAQVRDTSVPFYQTRITELSNTSAANDDGTARNLVGKTPGNTPSGAEGGKDNDETLNGFAGSHVGIPCGDGGVEEHGRSGGENRSVSAALRGDGNARSLSPFGTGGATVRLAFEGAGHGGTAYMQEQVRGGQTAAQNQNSASGWRIIGEAMATYILVERAGSLFIIDKHAAHERMLFDKLKRETGDIMSQQLLAPFICPMDTESADALVSNREYLEKFGFEIDEFGSSNVALRAVPADIKEEDIPVLLSELAEKLAAGHKTSPDELRDGILHSVACRAAIKAGKYSPEAELAPIADAVMSGRVKYCPHGRPVAMELTKNTLDKNFKRI